MVAIPLKSGAYQAESLIANAQRCINMFPEVNPASTDPKFPTTHYPRPGLKQLSAPPQPGAARGAFTASNGDPFAVIGQQIYYIDANFVFNPIGNLQTALTTPVSGSDNGTNAVIVDGSPQGVSITLGAPYSAASVAQIADPNFLGADRVDFNDSFLVFNKPGTNEWYSSLSQQVAFNGLFVGIKTAWPGIILGVLCVGREVWIIGTRKSEIWYNAGGVPFPFNILPGVIIEHGCAAKYSLAKMDTNLYWLSQSPEGARMVMRGNTQHVAQRISTHAIEKEFLTYPRVDDCIGSTYQIEGHSFYELHFPTADVTWAFDAATEQWWQDASIDRNGRLHRARNTFPFYAYGKNLALDFATGALYQIDLLTLTDNGMPIPWLRSFPHLANENHYLQLPEIIADVETGTRAGTGEDVQFLSPWSAGFNQGFGPLTQVPVPVVNLRISRDGGYTFGNYRPKQRVSSGRYRSMMRWRGNGMARDWVLEFSSTAEMSGALNGGYVDPIAATA